MSRARPDLASSGAGDQRRPGRNRLRPVHAQERLASVPSLEESEEVEEPVAAEEVLSDLEERLVAEPNRVLEEPPPGSDDRDPDALDVRPIVDLLPVPPVRRPRRAGSRPRRAARERVRQGPVYDPFTARRRRTPEWLINYVAVLVLGDLVAGAAAVLVAGTAPVPGRPPAEPLAIVAALLWPVLLALLGTYAERRQGTGADEYRRVVVAGVLALAAAGVAGALMPGMERLVLVGAGAATLLTLGFRVLARRRLHAARRRGDMAKNAILVGRDGALHDLVRRLECDPTAGFKVMGVCVPTPESEVLAGCGVPVLGDLTEVCQVVDQARPDAVLVASASETAGEYLRDLAWRLEGTNVELLVSPGVLEVAPGRLQVRPTTSGPLLHIQEPEFRGMHRFVKRLMDRMLAPLLLLVAAPLMLAIAVAVKLDSRGPVFYRHRRIGKRGREFDLLKFRSMVCDAPSDVELMMLNEGNQVQFKMRCDPRVTRVGGWLRRTSLDELPQLINVLKGQMSLVGPRPHVTREVEQYGPDAHRRLLVEPGITGLWQVSGRSDLSWEEAVELDVRYVENWSIALDLSILWRTLRVVVRRVGAY